MGRRRVRPIRFNQNEVGRITQTLPISRVMGKVSRRGLLLGLACGGVCSLAGRGASATTVRSLSLPALVKGSGSILVVTPLASESRYEELGRRRRIVTDTRVRVEEVVAKGQPETSELLVRTLGGAIGNLGEHVHGQAQLALGQACVAFLLRAPDGLHYVNAMAQGHYPLRGSAALRLDASPDLPRILDFDASAVKVLVGSELGQARERIRSAVAR